MDEAERRKAAELLREIRQGADENQGGNENRLTWMYKGPSDLVDREEYLLGKPIDKSFEGNSNGDSAEIISRSYEPSNIPKRLLAITESTEQVDIAKKILEDPLYAIKQKELEARRKLLDNPVKLKELKKMVMERNMKKLERQQNKKRKKTKDIMNDEKALNKKILKKLRILSESHRRKLLEEAAESSDTSSESDSKKRKKSRKKKKAANKDSSESSSENESASDDSSRERKKKRESGIYRKRKHASAKMKKVSQNERDYKFDKRGETERGDKRNSSINKSREFRNHKGKRNIKSKSRSSSSSTTSSSSSESGSDSCISENSSSETSSFGKGKNIKKVKNMKEKYGALNKRRANKTDKYSNNELNVTKSKQFIAFDKKEIRKNRDKKDQRYRDSDSCSDRNRNDEKDYKRYRRDSHSKIRDRSERSNIPKENRKLNNSDKSFNEKSRNTTSPKKLSDKERDCKLKEMMENAKIRKEERENNLARHRKIQSEEEKLKDYDDDFMRRQISHAASKGTVADRIKSNVNNIQRSKDDMNRSFMRK